MGFVGLIPELLGKYGIVHPDKKTMRNKNKKMNFFIIIS